MRYWYSKIRMVAQFSRQALLALAVSGLALQVHPAGAASGGGARFVELDCDPDSSIVANRPELDCPGEVALIVR